MIRSLAFPAALTWELHILIWFMAHASQNNGLKLQIFPLYRKHAYTRSGRKWCTTAQKAIPFLQEVVRLVTLTPWYSRVTSLHHSSKSCPGVVSFTRSDFPSPWKGRHSVLRTGPELLAQWKQKNIHSFLNSPVVNWEAVVWDAHYESFVLQKHCGKKK